MDTTLRDGEQTSGVSFSSSEKLTITQLLLEELRVDRVEVASARVSNGEFEAVRSIAEWAGKNGYLDAIEVLSFVDKGVSIDWIAKAGVKVQNLLTKILSSYQDFTTVNRVVQHEILFRSIVGIITPVAE